MQDEMYLSIMPFKKIGHYCREDGIFDKKGGFHETQKINREALRDLFKNKLFEILLERDIISQETVTLISSWYHSGFDVHYERKIHGSDKEAVENIIRYITRPPISQEKVQLKSNQDIISRNTDYIPSVDDYICDPVYEDF